VAGLIITAFALRVRIDLVALTPMRRIRPSRILTLCMVSVGLNLLGVGLVPLNTFAFIHDRLASGIMLSFLGLLVVVVLRRRHVNPLLLRATVGTASALVAAIALFLTGVVNLAALELVGFTLIFVWVGVFTVSLERGMSHARNEEPAAADERSSAFAKATRTARECDAAPAAMTTTAAVRWTRSAAPSACSAPDLRPHVGTTTIFGIRLTSGTQAQPARRGPAPASPSGPSSSPPPASPPLRDELVAA